MSTATDPSAAVQAIHSRLLHHTDRLSESLTAVQLAGGLRRVRRQLSDSAARTAAARLRSLQAVLAAELADFRSDVPPDRRPAHVGLLRRQANRAPQRFRPVT